MIIAHLYYDLLNLYGESGNVKALKMQLENQGIKVTVKFLTINDQIKLDEYDFVYIGMGTEENQKLVLKHMIKYKNEFKKAILNDKFFLVTGNAIELFGEYIIDKNNKKYKGLNIFNFNSKEENFRIVGEVLGTCKNINKPIIAFQNRNGVMRDINENNLFNIIKGTGYNPKDKLEGIIKNNFYGTYLIGPILVRNPELLKYFVKNLILSRHNNFKFRPFNLTLENKAYQTFIDNYYKDYVNKNNG